MPTSKYQMWFMKDHGAAKLPIPILPESYEYTLGGSAGASVDIIGLGEVVQRKDRDCLRVSFSSWIPTAGDPATERYVPDAFRRMASGLYCFAMRSFLANDTQPVQIVIVGTPINMYCWIEEFIIRERGGAGNVGVYEYDLSLVEYREPGTAQVEVDPATGAAILPPQVETRPDTRIAPDTYTVQPGDSIASIARRFYGSDTLMNSIFEKNRDRLANPLLLESGTVLVMPL